jgi:hypothetical protein
MVREQVETSGDPLVPDDRFSIALNTLECKVLGNEVEPRGGGSNDNADFA